MQRKMPLLPAPYQALRTPEKHIHRPNMARAAQVVDDMNLDGEWLVTCLGWARIFNRVNDHKIIKDGEGFNRAVGIEGAYFYTAPATGNRYILDYNHPRNDNFFKDVVDIVEILPDGTAKGVLYKAERRRFKFTLTRVK